MEFQVEQNYGDGCKGFIYFKTVGITPLDLLSKLKLMVIGEMIVMLLYIQIQLVIKVWKIISMKKNLRNYYHSKLYIEHQKNKTKCRLN